MVGPPSSWSSEDQEEPLPVATNPRRSPSPHSLKTQPGQPSWWLGAPSIGVLFGFVANGLFSEFVNSSAALIYRPSGHGQPSAALAPEATRLAPLVGMLLTVLGPRSRTARKARETNWQTGEAMTTMRSRPERAMVSNPGLSPVTVLPLVTFVASAWLAAIVFYRELPELLPTHWSTSWKADDFTAKPVRAIRRLDAVPWGTFVFPAIMTVVWLARRRLRHLSFPRARVERFPGAFAFRIMLTIGCSS
jgi:hypothetical protein